MPIEWLAVWGVSQVAGKLVWPVLEEFANDVVNDSAKDYVKGCFGNVFSPLHKDALQKALGKALAELLKQVQEGLLDTGLTPEQAAAWVKDAKRFARSEGVQTAMRELFTNSATHVPGSLLQAGWEKSPDTDPLPAEFDWELVAKRFSRAVLNLREQDTELRAILQTQSAVEAAEVLHNLEGVRPGFDLAAYRLALRTKYQTLELSSLDPYHHNIVKLRSVFVPQTARPCQEYAIQLLELPKEYWRRLLGKEDLSEAQFEQERAALDEKRRAFVDQAPRPVLETINAARQRRLVILGDPGSGKSSLLRYLALQWTDETTTQHSRSLPLFIELRAYDRWDCDSGKSFLRYLDEGQTWHRLNELNLDEHLKTADNTVLLLDGLDEIFDADRRKLALDDLQRFADAYPKVKIILTSRVIGYEKSQQRMLDLEFTHLMLQDLDDAQIAEFLDRWHQVTFSDARDSQTKKAQLAKAIRESRAIRELAGNPLLLTLMAILNRQQELPRDRARLYERATQLLLLDWKTEQLHERFPQLKEVGIGFDEKAAMLRNVAHFMQTSTAGERGNIIAKADLVRILREYLSVALNLQPAHGLAQALVEQLRGQNFILCDLGDDHYAFVHRTFLEYFCAEAFVKQFYEKYEHDYLRDQLFAPHWRDESWHETLALTAGLVGKKSVEDLSHLIEFLLEQEDETDNFRHLFLAGRCCQELRNPRVLGKAFEKTRDAFIKLLTLDHLDLKWTVFKFLTGRDLWLQAITIIVNAPLIEQPLTWLIHAAQDSNKAVRQAALRALAHGWKDNLDTLSFFKARATQDEHFGIRHLVLLELARGWKDDPDTLPILKARATQDDNERVRQAAVQELARGWKDDPEVQQWLEQIKQTEESDE